MSKVRRVMLRSMLLGSLVVGAVACASSTDSSTGTTDDALKKTHGGSSLTAVASFGENPANLTMWEYVPASAGKNAPVVVILHGCVEHAVDAADAGWNQLADEKGFIAVYPEQVVTNNGDLCFDWSNAMSLAYDDAERGFGENESIREMAAAAVKRHGADPKRVFVAGFSAGAAEAVVMAALYPDVFAGAASFAGVPYGCADTLPESVACMEPGIQHTPAQWGALVRNAFSGYKGARPRVQIWQGSLDSVVYPQNQTELVKQWTNVHGVDDTADVSDTVDGQPHQAWKDANGNVVVETYLVQGMWHGMPVDPAHGCGVTGTFAYDFGICGARRATEGFGL